MNILLRICTPSPECRDWGDTPFGERLADAFRQLGHNTAVQTRRDWDDTPANTDLVLVLTGMYRHEPKPGPRNILWIISHPELRTITELNRYDAVFIASEKFANTVRGDVKIPVYALPQCTDPTWFTPRSEVNEDIDILFVGNNYYHDHPCRLIVADLLQSGWSRHLRVVGKDWAKGVPPECILGEYVDYTELPALYARAKINLNDHHKLMQIWGFVNNRTYDLAAASKFQISDPVPSIEALGVITYGSPAELGQKVEFYLAHPQERHRQTVITRELTRDATFLSRARTILEKLQ